MVHSGKILFTPLPQLHMSNILIDNDLCDEDNLITLEYKNSEDLHKVFFDIVSYSPSVVTFSVYLWNFKVVEQLSHSLKRYYGDKCWIIWGGPHISEDPIYFTQRYSESADFFVSWYGERPIQRIMEANREFNHNLEKSKMSLASQRAKGIYFVGDFIDSSIDMLQIEVDEILKDQEKSHKGASKEKDRYNKFTGNTFGIRAGDFIPFSNIPQAYQKNRIPKSVSDEMGERIFQLESYRGCPFSCSYCLWGVADKKIDYHSSDRMIYEFNNLVEIGARQFNLADAGFGLKKVRDLEFLKNVLEIGKINADINLSGYFFWQTLNDDFLDVLEELVGRKIMGQLDVGIQTFNKEAAKVMYRPTNYVRFEDTVHRIKKRRIPFQMDLILGLPGDDLNGYLHSVQNVMKLRPNKFQTFPLSILPGSNFDKRREELGIKTLRGSRTMDQDTVISTSSFPIGDMSIALNIESFFYLTYTLRLFNKTVYFISDSTGTSFYDVTMSLRDWSKNNNSIIVNLVEKYYNLLYEDRHAGRTALDNFLFKNYDDIHLDILSFIEFYYKDRPAVFDKKAMLSLSIAKEMLSFDMLIFPKKYETIKHSSSFKSIVKKSDNKKYIVAKFKNSEVLKLNNVSECTSNNKEKLVKFSHRDCNFREGGISTQYNFWKWNVEHLLKDVSRKKRIINEPKKTIRNILRKHI